MAPTWALWAPIWDQLGRKIGSKRGARRVSKPKRRFVLKKPLRKCPRPSHWGQADLAGDTNGSWDVLGHDGISRQDRHFGRHLVSIWFGLGPTWLPTWDSRGTLGGPLSHPLRSCLALGAKKAPRLYQEGLYDRFLNPTWPQDFPRRLQEPTSGGFWDGLRT